MLVVQLRGKLLDQFTKTFVKIKGQRCANTLPTVTSLIGHMSILETKTCRTCKQEKLLKNFYIRDNGKRRNDCVDCLAKRNKKYYSSNKEQIAKTSKEWAQKNKDKIRNANLQKKFGISLEEKNQLFNTQKKCCAICKAVKNNKNRDWDVDHCHETGVVRGILCSNCNRALGLFQDNPEILLNAYSYLNKWKH